MASWSGADCTTCGRPPHAGYARPEHGERCCDPCHGPHLTGEAAAQFIRFHGKQQARRFMQRRVAA